MTPAAKVGEKGLAESAQGECGQTSSRKEREVSVPRAPAATRGPHREQPALP